MWTVLNWVGESNVLSSKKQTFSNKTASVVEIGQRPVSCSLRWVFGSSKIIRNSILMGQGSTFYIKKYYWILKSCLWRYLLFFFFFYFFFYFQIPNKTSWTANTFCCLSFWVSLELQWVLINKVSILQSLIKLLSILPFVYRIKDHVPLM